MGTRRIGAGLLAGVALGLGACSGGSSDATTPATKSPAPAGTLVASAPPDLKTPASTVTAAVSATATPAASAETTVTAVTPAATASPPPTPTAAGGQPAQPPTTTPPAPEPPPPTATPPATQPPPPTPVPTSAGAPATVTVTVSENSFNPRNATVAAGGTVTWQWIGQEDHNVVGDGFSSGRLRTGSYSFTFSSAGTYPYVCIYHESKNMKGTITVQ